MLNKYFKEYWLEGGLRASLHCLGWPHVLDAKTMIRVGPCAPGAFDLLSRELRLYVTECDGGLLEWTEHFRLHVGCSQHPSLPEIILWGSGARLSYGVGSYDPKWPTRGPDTQGLCTVIRLVLSGVWTRDDRGPLPTGSKREAGKMWREM